MANVDFARVERAFQSVLAARETGGVGAAPDVTALCEGDPALAAEVRSLLEHHDAAGDDVATDAPRGHTAFLDPAELHGERAAAGLADRGAMLDEWGAAAVGQRVGEFTLIEQVGAGGMGVVFIARQERPQRTVALKLVRRSAATPALIRRFEREAQLLGRLNHPGIAQVYAAGVADILVDSGATVRTPYIAMEFVEGMNVLEFVRAWPDRQRLALELVAQACDAIQHAHQRGVIHRDLKPANLLVTMAGADGPRVKVLDFGVAREAGDSRSGTSDDAETRLTLHGHLVGTLAYMSPEQMRGGGAAVDTRCDVYALGAILYQLLTDRLPVAVDGCSLVEAARRIVEVEPASPGSIDRSLRGDVETIVSRALEKEPARRYESPAALARDVRHYLAGETIEARRASVIYVLRKQAVRYRNMALTTVVLLSAAVAFAIYAGHQERLQTRTAHEALAAQGEAEEAQKVANQTAAALAAELSAVRIEQGRLLGQNDLIAAERLLWDELFEHPDSLPARWALRELYWRTRCVTTIAAHAGSCRAVSVAPDEASFATAGEDGAVRIWTLPEGRKVKEFDSGSRTTNAVRFSPDGVHVAVAGTGGAFLFEWATGARRELGPRGVGSFGIQFARDGRTIALGSEDGMVRLLDAAGGGELLAVPPPARATTRGDAAPDVPRAVDLDPDCRNLAVVYLSGRVRLWRLKWDGGRASVEPGPSIEGHTGAYGAALRFAPDGKTFATGGTDRSVKLWNVGDGSLAKRFITYNGTARSVEFSPDGRRLVVPGYWRTQIFDVETGRMSVMGDGGGFAGQFASGGRRLVVGCTDGTCRVWDFGVETTTVLKSTPWLVRDLGVAHVGDTTLLASIQGDGELRVRQRADSGDGKWAEVVSRNVGARARTLAMTREGDLIVVGRDDGRLVTLRAADGSVVQDVGAHEQVINTVRLAPDGRTLVTGGADKVARLWRRRADGAGWEPRARMAFDGEVLGAAFSPDGGVVATTSRLAALRFWSAVDGRPILQPTVDKVPYKPVFSPDGQWVVAGGWDLAIRFWRVATPAPAGGTSRPLTEARHEYSLLGHSQLISAEAFDESGELMASVSGDGVLRIWDVAEMTPRPTGPPAEDRRRCLVALDAGVGDAYAVTFLPADKGGGRAVAVGYIDGTVRVWNLGRFDGYLRGHVEHQAKLRGRTGGGGVLREHEAHTAR
jgi:WD40 repeat protein/serine/threonine protein kinase